MTIRILAIESSCDETAVAILQDGREVLANLVSSQVDLHRRFGGVVPEVACRAHMEVLLPMVDEALQTAKLTPADLDAVAVTNRPGLIGALLVGVSAAKGLALSWDKPLIGVNHIEGHIAAASFSCPEMTHPFIALVVSGGHTNIFRVQEGGICESIAHTLDDAAGEAFDKAAKLLDLGFPGGPVIDKAAKLGNPKAFPWLNTCLPKDGENFSFSGLKTAVLYAARGQRAGRKGPLLLDEQGVRDAAASFQYAVVHALVKRTVAAAKHAGVQWIAIGGGVAANSMLRETLKAEAEKIGCKVAVPPMSLCTDNAVMIAVRATELYRQGVRSELSLPSTARGN